jgi:hypothetical protein
MQMKRPHRGLHNFSIRDKIMAMPRGLKATYLTDGSATPSARVATTNVTAPIQAMTMHQAASVGWEAYLWGWPLVNAAIRARRAAALNRIHNGPVVEGGMPVAFGRIAMLTSYMNPDERGIACPNQDVVYGAGIFDALDTNPIVFQVPDFGDRYWSFALYDARTNEFGSIGKQSGTAPGFYLLAGPNWIGNKPDGISEVVNSTTNLAFVIPRIFKKDTPEEEQAVKPLINQIDFYPLSEYDGTMTTRDWEHLKHVLPCWLPRRRDELQFVKPETFLRDLRNVVDTVQPQVGETELYARITGMLAEAANDWRIRMALRETFRHAEHEMITPLMQWSQNGRPAGNGWNTSVRSAEWGTSYEDYLHRTATARSNMFESRPHRTRYFYTDKDSQGEPLNGQNVYAINFAAGQLPPVKGFWSLSLYDEFHFFHTDSNPLDRYSLGTKNNDALKYNPDGSLTLYAGGLQPVGGETSNWLPAPMGDPFSLYIRAYQPEDSIGTWLPPLVVKTG